MKSIMYIILGIAIVLNFLTEAFGILSTKSDNPTFFNFVIFDTLTNAIIILSLLFKE